MSVSVEPGRYARMLQILEQLQSGRGLNAKALAGQLNVCRRTIFRDLRTMREAGIEFYFDRLGDCYRLATEQSRAGTAHLEPEELTALMVAAHLSVLAQLPAQQALLQRSVDKLLAVSPRTTQHLAQRVVRSCRLMGMRRQLSPQTSQIVNQVLHAIAERKVLKVTLFDTQEDCELQTGLAPYQVLAAADAWQVVARSSYHRAVRTFDLQHLSRPQITDQVYAIPRNYRSVA